MAKLKWIKVWTDMVDNEKMILIDTLPERDTIQYIWMRLLIQAGKRNANGEIFLTEGIPYTDEMLATILNRPVESIKLALKTLMDFKMIDISESNIIKILNWESYQNVESMDRVREDTRKRVAACRKRKKAKKQEEKLKELEKVQDDNVEDIKVEII